MLSYAMVCGAGGFATERGPYSYYQTVWFFTPLPQGKFSQNYASAFAVRCTRSWCLRPFASEVID